MGYAGPGSGKLRWHKLTPEPSARLERLAAAGRKVWLAPGAISTLGKPGGADVTACEAPHAASPRYYPLVSKGGVYQQPTRVTHHSLVFVCLLVSLLFLSAAFVVPRFIFLLFFITSILMQPTCMILL